MSERDPIGEIIAASLASAEWTREVTSRIVDGFRQERDAERALADDLAATLDHLIDIIDWRGHHAGVEAVLARYREARNG